MSAGLVWHTHLMSSCNCPCSLVLPLQSFSKWTPQLCLPFHWRRTNHLSRQCLTTFATPFIPNRPFNSTLDILFLRLTPHIHLTIIHSVLSKRCISSVFTGQVSLPYNHLHTVHSSHNISDCLRTAAQSVDSISDYLGIPAHNPSTQSAITWECQRTICRLNQWLPEQCSLLLRRHIATWSPWID